MRLIQPFSAALVALAAIIPLTSSAAVSKPEKGLSPRQAGTYWLEHIEHQGIAAFNPNPDEYKVFRNVKDYGAKGDGSTDDTEAINAAIRDGNRCGRGCDSSTITPAIIYFPAGVYMVSKPIVAMYYSQLIGNINNRPVIKAAPGFKGIGVIDSDPYENDGSNWYTNQNNFFRAIRNFVIDTTLMGPNAGTGMHWQVAQASSLVNIHFELSQAPGNLHQGIFMDNGSGGFMSDLSFNGGNFGMWIGNQQFMTRKLKFTNCKTAIYLNWDWQWTFKSISIENAEIGLDISSTTGEGIQQVGSVILLDSQMKDVQVALRTARDDESQAPSGGSAILDNVKFINVGKGVAGLEGNTILEGGSQTIDFWGQGSVYSPDGSAMRVQGPMTRQVPKPAILLNKEGKIFERTRPQYKDTPVTSFLSVRDLGAKGDGKTDDTQILREIFQTHGGNPKRVIFFDHGHYLITDTIYIPVNTRVIGEAWATILAGGNLKWQDPKNPEAVVRVGNPGDEGLVELSELIIETKGPQPGAIMLQWWSRDRKERQGENGMWDVHLRVAGTAGTDLEVPQCLHDKDTPVDQTNFKPECQVAFLLLHITESASVYIENCWAWTADHALDKQFDRISVYNARGILAEKTQGPVWMYAAAPEHNTLYQFQFDGAANVFMGMIQTETPYFQSNPGALVPFPALKEWNDPTYADCTGPLCAKSWALRILNSTNIFSYGSGLYSFFENYVQECIEPNKCQDSVVDVRSSTNIALYNVNTVGTTSIIDYEGQKLALANQNRNTFAATVMKFEVGSDEL